MNKLLSLSVSTLAFVAGRVKLGHPVPESNLSSESKSSFPQHTQRYTPGSLEALYFPVNAGSVPFCLVIRYCSGVSSARHWSSVFRIFSVICLVGFLSTAIIIRRWNRNSLQPFLPHATHIKKALSNSI